MNLDRIVISEADGQHESLALALQAVAAGRGVALNYDDLCAALGVSFAAVSTTAESSPGWWLTYGRDVFLEPAGRLFGLQLRPLHPPDVGLDMLHAAQFGQHFEDAYKPLIRVAVENGQPVLAWRGWPDSRAFFWGVITGERDGGFEGTTLWADGRRLPLTGPATQCWAVERCEPVVPPPTDLFALAMRHADAYMNRAPFTPAGPGAARPELVTGPAAFDAWELWLQTDDFGDPSADLSWHEHRRHAEFLAAGRQSAARFLRRLRSTVSRERAEIVDQAIACCESLVERLAESRDEDKVRLLFATRQGRHTLLEAIRAAEADDRRLAGHVAQLV